MGLREEKKQATRAAIVDTALVLFQEKGFAATRITDITARLRISEATFFNYFPTKESVLEAVGDGLIEAAMSLLEHEAGDGQRSVTDRLRELTAGFADQLDGDPAFVILLAGNTRYFLGSRTARFARAHALLTSLFAEGQDRGEVRDDVAPAQLAEMFLAATFGTIQDWVQTADEVHPLGDRLRLGSMVLLDGVVVSPTPRAG